MGSVPGSGALSYVGERHPVQAERTAVEATRALAAQVDDLALQLERARKTLTMLGKTDPYLYNRVSVQFEDLIVKRQRDLDGLRRQSAAGEVPGPLWKSLSETRKKSTDLFKECLAFMEGALVRRAGLDDDLCRIADGLLDDLSQRSGLNWNRLTTLSTTEFFGEVAQIIRIRFPDISVWSLPIAAHEFGHFAGPELRRQKANGAYGAVEYPFQEILESEWELAPKYWSYAHELFADVFATYTLGPAYVYPCVLLRFDPCLAHKDGERHPSPAKRVYAMLKTLEEMDRPNGIVPVFGGAIRTAQRLWTRNLVAVGQPPEIDRDSRVDLDETWTELYGLINEILPGLQYTTHTSALQLKAALLSDTGSPRSDRTNSLANVLNAAWACRVELKETGTNLVAAVGDRATRLCFDIIERRRFLDA